MAATIHAWGLSAGLEREWDGLADRAGASPFLRPGWLTAWWRAFGGGQPEVVAVRRGKELAGIAVLRALRFGLAAAANDHTPEFGLLAADEEARRQLAQAVLRRRPRVVVLPFLVRDGRDAKAFASEAARLGYALAERSRFSSPSVVLEGSWSSYEQGLSGNLRGDVRRRRRRLEEAGTAAVEIHDGRERLDELLDEGIAVEGSGWKTDRRTAIASLPETRRFYAEIAAWAAERGWLRLCFLRLDGRVAAFHLDLEADRALYHLKGGYDPELERLSPSKLLHYALLERAFGLGLERYEFLGAPERYKLQFANGSRDLAALWAFAPTPAGVAARAAVVHGRPLVRRLVRVVRR